MVNHCMDTQENLSSHLHKTTKGGGVPSVLEVCVVIVEN